MGLIDMIKPLSTVQSSAVNKSQQPQEKNSWECRDSNPGPHGAKRERFPLCYGALLNFLTYMVTYLACLSLVDQAPRTISMAVSGIKHANDTQAPS